MNSYSHDHDDMDATDGDRSPPPPHIHTEDDGSVILTQKLFILDLRSGQLAKMKPQFIFSFSFPGAFPLIRNKLLLKHHQVVGNPLMILSAKFQWSNR